MIEAPHDAQLRVLDPNEHINELRRRLRRELVVAESLFQVNPTSYQDGLCMALRVALELLVGCHRHEKLWYNQHDLYRVREGLASAYRAKHLQEPLWHDRAPWFMGFSHIWRRVLAILERLQVVEVESSQSENRSAEALR